MTGRAGGAEVTDGNPNVWRCVAPQAEPVLDQQQQVIPATSTPTDTPAPRAGCVNTTNGVYILFPASNFLSGSIPSYPDDQCANANLGLLAMPDDGLVYTTARAGQG